jgi:hypothetical protein
MRSHRRRCKCGKERAARPRTLSTAHDRRISRTKLRSKRTPKPPSLRCPPRSRASGSRCGLPRFRCWTKQDTDGRWRVHAPVAEPEGLPALLDVVQYWLWTKQIAETQARVGNSVYRMTPSEKRTGAERAVAGRGDGR